MFARPIQDLLPVLPGKLRLHDYWDHLLDDRERTIADRGSKEHAKWSAPSPLSWLETRSGYKTSQVYPPVDGTNSASSLRLGSHARIRPCLPTEQKIPPPSTSLVVPECQGSSGTYHSARPSSREPLHTCACLHPSDRCFTSLQRSHTLLPTCMRMPTLLYFITACIVN